MSCRFGVFPSEGRPSKNLSASIPKGLRSLRYSLKLFFFLFFCFSAIKLASFDSHAAEIFGNSEEPVYLKADRLQYLKELDIYFAEGHTEAKQGSTHLKADMLRLKGKTGVVSAMGHIRYFDGQNNMDAERIEMNLNTKLGKLYHGRLFIKENNYYLEGDEIIRHEIDRFEFKSSSFTACDCQENPAWRIRAGNLDLTVDEYLIAKHTRFYVKDVPIFYLPYFIYPATQNRQSGLLIPRIGYSNKYGFRYKQELFLALAENQDATLEFEDRDKKGQGIGLQYRYVLSKNAHGELNADFFKDKEDNVDRWEVRLNHLQKFSSRLEGKLDLKYINLNSNLRDLSNQTSARAQQNIESNLSLTYLGDSSYAYLLARYTQDLTQASNNNTPQKLPEIGYSLIEYRPGNAPLYFNFDSTAVNFWSEGGLNLIRVDLYPKISLPISLGKKATLTPWAAFRETWYQYGNQNQDVNGPIIIPENITLSRKVVPTGITLRGNSATHWGETTQNISAEIFYEKIAVRDEANIYEIDEIDTLHDRQNITATLIQRFLKINRRGIPEEKVSLRFTETYHPDKISTESLNNGHRFSDLRTELHLRPWSPISLEVDTFYDLYDGQITSVNTDIDVKMTSYVNIKARQRTSHDGALPKKGDLFNPYYLGDRETVTPEVDFWSGEVALNTPWGLQYINRVFYEADQGELVEIDHILTYNAQCWGVSLSYIEFFDRTEFSFLITLKGLGGISPEQ